MNVTKPPRRSMRGILLVVGLFALGGVVLAGLFLAPRLSPAPRAPAGAAWGVPARPLRFASYNILHGERGLDRVAGEIRKLDPDFVLLQEAESRDAAALARALGMTQSYHPRMYHRSANLAGPRASWGNLILSRHPIYEADSIPNPGGGSFGVWAVAVVDGKKFIVANVHLSATWKANPLHVKESGQHRHRELTNLKDAWRARGSPPMIVGGDFNQIPIGNNYHVMTQDWTDALASLGHKGNTFTAGLLRTRIDYFLTTPHWKPLDAGVVQSNGSDHRPIWLQATAADPANATTTRPATSTASQ